MKRYSSPITEENFDFSSKFILKKCRNSLGKRRAYKVVTPVSTILYMLLTLLFTYGAMYSMRTAEDEAVFEKFKPLNEIWQFFADMLIREGAKWYINAAMIAGFLILVPMAISVILTIVIRITTKARVIGDEARSTKEKAKALHGIIEKSYHSNEIDYGVVGMVNAGVYIALVLAFTIYSMVMTIDDPMMEDLASIIFGAAVVYTILYFAHAYIFIIYHFINACICLPTSIYQYKVDLYDFWCSIDPEEAENRAKKEKEAAAKKAASQRDSLSIYRDTAYYKEKKEEALRKYRYGNNYPTYEMSGPHYEAKEDLKRYLESNAPYELKQEAIKRFNDHYLDNFQG